MIKKYHLLLFVLYNFAISCTSSERNTQVIDSLAATSLQPYGRYLVDTVHGLELIGSAVHFTCSFDGDTCQVFATIPNGNGNSYLQYVLDGVYQKRLRVMEGSNRPLVIRALKSGTHILSIYKATEAQAGPVFIQKLVAENIKSIPNANAPVIEFIGNSITCGAAADGSEIPCSVGEYHDHHNAYDAYGPRVARALGVNYFLSSVSGIGVYRNWNSDGPAMPQVYEKAQLQDRGSQLWDFKTYTPQVVSIALGTNDLSNGDGIRKRLPFDSSVFIKAYVEFVKLVKTKYPGAVIALLSSPMVGGTNGRLLQRCLQEVKKNIDAAYPGGKPVALYFFEPMVPHGCSGHPSVEDHAILASALTPFFKNLLQ